MSEKLNIKMNLFNACLLSISGQRNNYVKMGKLKNCLKYVSIIVVLLIVSATGSWAQTATALETNNFKVTTPYGFVQLGPQNSSWSHFTTNMDKFYFNKSLYINGSLHSYTGNDLNLGTYGTTTLTISESDAFVGIGTANPSSLLHIQDNTTTGWFQNIKGQALNSDEIIGLKLSAGFSSEFGKWGGIATVVENNAYANNTGLALYANESERVRIASNGNVGIGTTSPSSKLEVDGTITSEEVKVEVVDAPDYVFALEYQLRSLQETEAYIKANSHLPEVPSAKEMEANGVELGEMNMLLLKKIEELTLHLIEQGRINAEQANAMAELNKEVQSLKSKDEK